MKRVFIALIMFIFTSLSFAQEINADSGSVSDAVQSLFRLNQPKLGFMAQFAGEVTDNGQTTTSAFTIRNLRMYFTGSVGEHFKYFFQGSLNKYFEMLDLKLSYILNEHLRIDGGRFKTGFGEEYLVNDAKLLFIKRSTAASTIGTFRKYGVQVQGSLFDKRLTLTGGAFNGEYSIPKKVSLFIGKAKVVPIMAGEIAPEFQWEASGSIAYSNNWGDLQYFPFRRYMILTAASTKFTYDTYWVSGEYYAPISDVSGRHRLMEGFYFDIGKSINDTWDIMGRFDWYANYYKQVIQNNKYQYVTSISRCYLIGVNCYPINCVKLQLDYERNYTLKINSAWLNCQYAINFE
jgi:hypothetical protein